GGAVGGRGGTSAWPSIGHHVGRGLGGTGLGALLGEAHRVLGLRAYLGIEGVQTRLIQRALLLELAGKLRDRVAFALLFYFFLGAIHAVQRVGHRVAHEDRKSVV